MEPSPGSRLAFLGGASGIGASCVYVELDGLRALVDVGVRQARGETLPDLATLQRLLDGAAPDVVVLTHAHLDHSGALPLVVRTWPGVPIVATRATADLVRILLQDALRIMELEREEEVPLFSQPEVERTLAAIRRVGFDNPVEAGGGRVRLLPAGHILGAAAAWLETERRQVVVTGDLSVADQRTVPGMPAPAVRPDALVVESTYGDRLHASRDAEERRLAEQVAETVLAGGHVLVPAFAVGRAQEVLLSLRAAMRRGTIPPFPVYADGMVRAVCDVYRHHPEFLGPSLRRRAVRGGDLFFPEGSGFARVGSADERRRVIEGPPCCVVASSGMLAGGASAVYARAWAGDGKNLIAITGYQDEESPGRAVLDVADGARKDLVLGGAKVAVKARVARYHLSAHADADEIAGLVRAMRPRAVYVVHGERRAREALAHKLADTADVVLPDDGDVLAVATRRSGRRPAPRGRGLAAGRPFDAAALEALRDVLLATPRGERRSLTAEEVAALWFGGTVEAEAVAATRALLDTVGSAFEPDRRRPYRYRPRAPSTPDAAAIGPSAVLERLDRQLEEAGVGPVRRSVHAEERRIVVRHSLPDAVRERLTPRLEALAAETGWTLTLHPAARQEALLDAARAHLAPEAAIVSASFHPEARRLDLRVDHAPADLDALEDAFLAATGWTLAVEVRGPVPVVAGTAATGGPALRPDEIKPIVEALFEDCAPELRPLRTSFPGGDVVLHFAAPGLARCHEDRLSELAKRAGRKVRVHPHASPPHVAALVAPRLPPHWEVMKPPAWVPQAGEARVVVWTLPDGEETRAVLGEIEEALGIPVRLVRED